jgi:PAS domain S-box-containing protein
MPTTLKILLAEDSIDDEMLVIRHIRRSGYEVEHQRVETAPDMQSALQDGRWDTVISDYHMPNFSAWDALRIVQESRSDLPFLVVSGTIGEESAVSLLKAGAHDFILKDRLARLVPSIEREMREAAVRQERKVAVESLQASEARFRAMMNVADDAIFATDSSGMIVLANPAAAQMFECTEEELMGFPVFHLLKNDSPNLGFEDFAHQQSGVKHRATGGVIHYRARRKNGSEFPAELSVGHWETCGQRMFALFIRDVSFRKEMEAQLLAADRMATVGTLVAGVAHEINNPLAAITGYLDLAMQELGSWDGPEAQGRVNSIVTQMGEPLERVIRIVQDLRGLAHGGTEGSAMEDVDVHEVLDSAIRVAELNYRHRGAVVTEYRDIPRARGNTTRLGQVFLNLIINAFQAIQVGKQGQSEVRVTTSFDEDQKKVIVEIHDSGCGMSEDTMRKLFRPFFTTKPLGEGTGLGLSISQRIVTALGGQIRVTSAPGKGSTFAVLLNPSVPSMSPAPSSKQIAASSRRLRVMVLDDEPILTKLVSHMLGDLHDVEAFNNASAALSRVRTGTTFDAILCDVSMPGVSGLQFLEELHLSNPDLVRHLAFMTGGYIASVPGQSSLLDSVRHLQKPFTMQEILRIVNELA